MGKHKLIREYNSNVHIYEFDPKVIRFDASIGVAKKLERLSRIKGEPRADEYAVAKINGGFFNMDGSSEYIGSFVDEGLYYNGSARMYPTIVFWKENLKLTMEMSPNQKRHADYQRDAYFAVGVPWSLIDKGKIDFKFTKNELIKAFGHPYQKHPRTLLGQKANGNIVWVVVDGRSKSSSGINITQSANLMQKLGCIIAVNLDGGGSSEMIVNDKIVNRPSDNGRERAIGTAFLAYAKKKASSRGGGSSTGTSKPSAGGSGKVTASALNVRSGPGTKHGVVGVLKNGAVVNILSTHSGWYKIKYNGKDAYVSASYIR